MSTRILDLAIAAIKNSRADLVAKEEQRAAASKGKSKATETDEIRDAEYRRQLEEHSSALDELFSTLEKQNRDSEAKTWQVAAGEPPYHRFPERNIVKSDQGVSDKDPYVNPFTGSYVFPETGMIALRFYVVSVDFKQALTELQSILGVKAKSVQALSQVHLQFFKS